MSRASISMHDDEHVTADVMDVPGAGPFIALRFGNHVSVYVPGYGDQAVASARQIIGTLTEAIATIEQADAGVPA